MLLGQNFKVVWAVAPANYSSTAATTYYVFLKKYGRLAAIVISGAWAGGTAAVTLSQATSVAGTGAKALALDGIGVNTLWTDSGGVQGTLVRTAVVSNTFNLSTANSCWVIEVDARSLDMANGFNAVGVAIASPGANADFYSVSYLLDDSLYAQDPPPSALV